MSGSLCMTIPTHLIPPPKNSYRPSIQIIPLCALAFQQF